MLFRAKEQSWSLALIIRLKQNKSKLKTSLTGLEIIFIATLLLINTNAEVNPNEIGVKIGDEFFYEVTSSVSENGLVLDVLHPPKFVMSELGLTFSFEIIELQIDIDKTLIVNFNISREIIPGIISTDTMDSLVLLTDWDHWLQEWPGRNQTNPSDSFLFATKLSDKFELNINHTYWFTDYSTGRNESWRTIINRHWDLNVGVLNYEDVTLTVTYDNGSSEIDSFVLERVQLEPMSTDEGQADALLVLEFLILMVIFDYRHNHCSPRRSSKII